MPSAFATKISQRGSSLLVAVTPVNSRAIFGCLGSETFRIRNVLGAEEGRGALFDCFYRVDKAHWRESGGAGLGLSIAKWAVEARGGSIVLESAPDLGSTFRISLPSASPI
jgi:Histidine kinase-, DNA gyrase B-, and HSP90-like ATPase